jgi:hypothetical protein
METMARLQEAVEWASGDEIVSDQSRAMSRSHMRMSQIHAETGFEEL